MSNDPVRYQLTHEGSTLTIEGHRLTKRVQVVVESGPAMSLFVLDEDQFVQALEALEYAARHAFGEEG